MISKEGGRAFYFERNTIKTKLLQNNIESNQILEKNRDID